MRVTRFTGGKTDVFPACSEDWPDLLSELEKCAEAAPGMCKGEAGFVCFVRMKPGTDVTIAELNRQRAKKECPPLSPWQEDVIRTRGYRNYDHVGEVTAIGIDYDEFPEEPPNWDPSAWPCDVYAHSTHNYHPTERPGKWRVILPLALPIPIEREAAVRKALQRWLPRGAILRAPHQPAFLPTCEAGASVQVRHVVQHDVPAALDWRLLPELDEKETIHAEGAAGATVLGAEFERRGMIARDLGSKLDVVCPWAGEHKSGGDLGYLYASEDGLGKFGCAHGACVNRCSNDVYALWMVDDEPSAQASSPDASPLVTDTPAAKPAPPSLFPLMSAEDMSVNEPIPWVINELVSVGEPTLIVGGAGSGKTSAMVELALSVATGRDVWGRFKVARPGPVVHIDYEQGKTLRRTYRAFAAGMGLDAAELVREGKLRIATLPREQLLDANVTDKHLSTVGKELVALTRGASICVLNSLTASTNKVNENDAKIAAVFNLLARITEMTGCAFIVLHHSGKMAAGSRGSSAIDGAVQTTFSIAHRKGDAHTLWTHVKDRPAGGLLDPFKLVWSGPGDVQTLKAETAQEEPPAGGVERPEDRIQRAILFVMANKGLSVKQRILECVRGKMTAKRSVWEDMVVRGLIEHVGSRYLVAPGVVAPKDLPDGTLNEEELEE